MSGSVRSADLTEKIRSAEKVIHLFEIRMLEQGHV